MKIFTLYRKRFINGKFDGKKYTQWNNVSEPDNFPKGMSPLMIDFVEVNEDYSI